MLQPGVNNSLFLASFNGRATPKGGTIKLTRLKTGEQLAEIWVEWNRVNHINLSSIKITDPPDLILLTSNDIAGIPIFFARDLEARHLSLEHTHPPMELTVFGRDETRRRISRTMRTAWLRGLSGV
jgi:hypothetical protein